MKREFEIIANLLPNNSRVLDVGCGDGTLMKFLSKEKNIDVRGLDLNEENVETCIAKGLSVIEGNAETELGQFPDKSFDFVIAFNSLYMQNLGDVIKSLKEIERVSKKSYVILASGENDKERNKFYRWTLIGTSILLKKEWKTLFKKIKFSGDYYFSSAKSLGV